METETEACPFCIAGWPVDFCLERPGEGCQTLADDDADTDTEPGHEAVTEAQEAPDGGLGDDSEDSPGGERVYKDARSTGRKRAAKLYPIQQGQVCDWAWSKQCGGGIKPIVGCTGRPAEHIHHGPDKSTFNNDRSNISLVCEYCHNRYHAANDPFYPEGRPENGEPWLPIVPEGGTLYALEDMIPATREEVFANELMYPVRGKDKKRLASE